MLLQHKSIPDMVPPANEAHPLAAFAVNPADYVSLDQTPSSLIPSQ